jgi:hypothetical protein
MMRRPSSMGSYLGALKSVAQRDSDACLDHDLQVTARLIQFKLPVPGLNAANCMPR